MSTETMDNWTGEGYDAEAGGDGGKFFRLKEKGQEARLRLVTPAYRYYDTIKDPKTSETKTVKKVAWGAILREPIPNSRLTKDRAVCYQAGPQVYKAIQEYVRDDEYGDPTAMDFKVTRTEETPFYSVRAAKPTPLTDADRQLAKEAALSTTDDIVALVTKKNGAQNSIPAPAANLAHSSDPDDPFANGDPFDTN